MKRKKATGKSAASVCVAEIRVLTKYGRIDRDFLARPDIRQVTGTFTRRFGQVVSRINRAAEAPVRWMSRTG